MTTSRKDSHPRCRQAWWPSKARKGWRKRVELDKKILPHSSAIIKLLDSERLGGVIKG